MKRVSMPGRVAALAAVVFLVIVAGPPRSVAATPKFKTGTVLKRTYDFKQAGKEMEYCLYIPKAYNKSKAWPLMVALHGLHSSARQILQYPGLTKQAEKHGFIVVAPMGYNDRGWYGSLGWKMKRGSPENLGELSEKDVMNVLAITRRELNIDNRRIYLMGHSMGGGGTWHLGLKYPKLWAGLAPIAPATYRSPEALTKIKDMPVIVVQGDSDKLVPVAMARRWVAKMKQLKMDYSYIEVAGGGHVRIAFGEYQAKIFEFLSSRKRKVPAKNVTPGAGSKPSAGGGKVKPAAAKNRYSGDLKHYEARTFTDKAGKSINYHLMKPVDFDAKKSYPVLLFLHGRGGCGSKNKKNLTDANVPKIFAADALRAKYPAIVLVPQCPRGSFWAGSLFGRKRPTMDALVIGMLDAVGKEFKTDKNRLYITGLSLGGFGTFGTVSARPDLFAAAAPVCGGWPGAKGVKGMAAVPFWIFHGGADNVVPAMLSKSIADALKAAGGTVKHTEYPGVGHNSWTRAYNTPELWEWLFAQKKKPSGRK